MIRLIRSLGVGLIPLLSLIAVLLGGSSFLWYSQLSLEEKANADRIAEGYAADLFDKARSELTHSESRHVDALTKGHFTT